jgi:hypothetical protein
MLWGAREGKRGLFGRGQLAGEQFAFNFEAGQE